MPCQAGGGLVLVGVVSLGTGSHHWAQGQDWTADLGLIVDFKYFDGEVYQQNWWALA